MTTHLVDKGPGNIPQCSCFSEVLFAEHRMNTTYLNISRQLPIL